MNKSANAIFKGQVVCAFVLGASLGALPMVLNGLRSAKAGDAEDIFKSRNANVSSLEDRNKEWTKLGDHF